MSIHTIRNRIFKNIETTLTRKKERRRSHLNKKFDMLQGQKKNNQKKYVKIIK